jgi:hypothetical protein
MIRHGTKRKLRDREFFRCICIRFRSNVFTEPFPSNEVGVQTDLGERFAKYAVDMGSGAMLYIRSLMKIGSDIRKLLGWGYTDSMEIV